MTASLLVATVINGGAVSSIGKVSHLVNPLSILLWAQ